MSKSRVRGILHTLGYQYLIFEDPKRQLLRKRDCGAINPHSQQIAVLPKMGPQEFAETILHEWVHSLVQRSMITADKGELPENVIDRIALSVLDLMVDSRNDWLWKSARKKVRK